MKETTGAGQGIQILTQDVFAKKMQPVHFPTAADAYLNKYKDSTLLIKETNHRIEMLLHLNFLPSSRTRLG